MKKRCSTIIALILVCLTLPLISCGPETTVSLFLQDNEAANNIFSYTADPAADIDENQTGGALKALATAVTVSEQTIYNQGGIEIEVVGFRYNGSVFGSTLTIKVVNSTTTDISVLVKSASVNGVMASATAWLDVPKSDAVTGDIVFNNSALEAAGVIVYGDIALCFRIIDAASLHGICETETLYIKTSAAAYTQAPSGAGEELYNEYGIRIALHSTVLKHDYFGAAIYFYVENNSEKSVMLSVAESTIDGADVEPVFSCFVAASSVAYECVGYMPHELEVAGITNIASAIASLRFVATDSLTNEIIFTADITITFD